MLPISKEVEISLGKVVLYDLTFGMVTKIEENIGISKSDIILDASNITVDNINKLRRSEVEYLYEEIIKLTYPELFNNDGTKKEIENTEDDKKKV